MMVNNNQDGGDADAKTVIQAAIGWVVLLLIVSAFVFWCGATYSLSDAKDAAARANLWQAWGTITAGVLAVAGAYHVGTRQLEISKQQLDIQANQTELQEQQADFDLKIRRAEVNIALIDRRLRIIKSLDELKISIHREKTDFYVNWHEVKDSLWEARLVFLNEHFEEINKVMEIAQKVILKQGQMENAQKFMSGDSIQQKIDAYYAGLDQFGNALPSLIKLLSDHAHIDTRFD